MEEKLKEFKARRRRANLVNAPKNFLLWLLGKINLNNYIKLSEIKNRMSCKLPFKFLDVNNFPVFRDKTSFLFASSGVSLQYISTSWLSLILYVLQFLLWVIFYLIALHLEFGFVYFVLSGLVFIYLNTRTSPKKIGELSAYSVFNPGCEAIEGTLKAEHFERDFNFIQYNKAESQ